eukprot:TRINITY_DN20251_c0_g1_i2.p1 TRINITY_DN20251_c0_g1~~TRINITY_DN20251_c0_g1_i2.p1  ORF type:complete len:370 (-),score=77.59 TRINITY_DN20251_c0_g1_i2:933-2042(-)
MSSPSGLHVRGQESNSSNAVSGSKPIGENVAKRLAVVEWLNSIFPRPKLSLEATEEELKAFLKDGTIFYIILYNLRPGLIPENQGVSSGKSFDIVNKFLSVMEEMRLPGFDALDLEKGSMSAVVECLLALRDHMDSKIRDTRSATKFGSQLRRWRLPEVENLEGTSGARWDLDKNSPGSGEERRKSLLDAKSQRVLRSPVASEPLTALSNHGGHTFHEVFQLKQGRYSDIPAAKISEMMKSNSLDNAPTQSLLSVVNGVLDESIERKNGEIPQRVACLLRRVVQEIERRISTQAEHIRNQNNVIKAREEKYQSRIRVLETLAMGTSEESQARLPIPVQQRPQRQPRNPSRFLQEDLLNGMDRISFDMDI